jgi:hypothetical protein
MGQVGPLVSFVLDPTSELAIVSFAQVLIHLDVHTDSLTDLLRCLSRPYEWAGEDTDRYVVSGDPLSGKPSIVKTLLSEGIIRIAEYPSHIGNRLTMTHDKELSRLRSLHSRILQSLPGSRHH